MTVVSSRTIPFLYGSSIIKLERAIKMATFLMFNVLGIFPLYGDVLAH
jgi:hypothetical protein